MGDVDLQLLESHISAAMINTEQIEMEVEMRMNLRVLSRVSLIAATLLLFGSVSKSNEYTLQISHYDSEDSSIHAAMLEFVMKVETRTGGQVRIEVFPNSQLGHFVETSQEIRKGAPIIITASSGYLGGFVSDINVLRGLFLMENPLDNLKFMNSDHFSNIRKRLRNESDFELLSLNWYLGSWHILAEKAVRSPSDIAGMTIWIPPNTAWTEVFTVLGASPEQMSWEEDVRSSMASRSLDGADASLEKIYEEELHKIRNVISLTTHFMSFTGLMMSADVYADFPSEIQDILSEEAVNAGEFMTRLVMENEKDIIAKLETDGATINRDVDLKAFREIAEGAYVKVPFWSAESYEKFRNAIDN